MDFSCNPAQQCLSTSIQNQCTVTDSTLMRWRIRDEIMTSLGTVSYDIGDDLVTTPAPFPNSLPFFTDYTSKSPSLISNISFTVQSSINGYTIHCEDIDGNMENCTIDIAGDDLVSIQCNLCTGSVKKSEKLLIEGNIEWNINTKSIMV